MQNTLTAAVLLIGDELLSGSIQDENLSHIAVSLEKRGIRVRETRVVPDIHNEIAAALNALRTRYDYVFTTGGIGPTHDDITSDSIAQAFGVDNVVQQDVFDAIQAYLLTKNIEFTSAAQRMAYAPEGAEMIHTEQSVVPGYRIDNVFVMAGVPSIMKIMLDAIVNKLKIGSAILSKKVHANVSEGEIAAALGDIQNRFTQVDIGSYPQEKNSTRSKYRVIFVVRGTDQKIVDQVCDEIYSACEQGGYSASIERAAMGSASTEG